MLMFFSYLQSEKMLPEFRHSDEEVLTVPFSTTTKRNSEEIIGGILFHVISEVSQRNLSSPVFILHRYALS